jgi:hypothetical protein
VVSAGESKDGSFTRSELGERVSSQPAYRLATNACRLDDRCLAELADVPAHERLRQPHVVDELGDARLTTGKALNDPQAVHVGEGLVERPKRSQLIGLVDDRRDGGADAGG